MFHIYGQASIQADKYLLSDKDSNLALFHVQGKVRPPTGADIAMQSFLGSFLEEHAEWRPDRDERYLNSALIPSVKQLYLTFVNSYMDSHETEGQHPEQPPMSLEHFRRRFLQWYPKVKIPRNNKFAQCDRCFILQEKVRLASADNKHEYRAQLAMHQEDVRRDKAQYYDNRYATVSSYINISCPNSIIRTGSQACHLLV